MKKTWMVKFSQTSFFEVVTTSNNERQAVKNAKQIVRNGGGQFIDVAEGLDFFTVVQIDKPTIKKSNNNSHSAPENRSPK